MTTGFILGFGGGVLIMGIFLILLHYISEIEKQTSRKKEDSMIKRLMYELDKRKEKK